MKYKTIKIELEIHVDKMPESRGEEEYLETNLNHDIQTVINYAVSRLTLGSDCEGTIGNYNWSIER